jgi:signal transduction histidine kinase/ligand-binding sensor domain-containing protein
MKQLTCFLLLLLMLNTAYAQQNNYSFTNFTTAQGLPDNRINTITQDSRGFIWIGTPEGLSRFDGKNFINFFAQKNDSIVTSNAFTNIYEYKKGHLVLNNYDKVICFNTYTEQFYFPPKKMQGFITSNKINNANTFYLTWRNKSYICNNNLEFIDSVENFPHVKKDQLLSIHYFTKNILLIQYYDAFCLYNLQTKKYEPILLDTSFTDKARNFHYRYYDSAKQELYFTEYFSGNYRYSLITKKLKWLKEGTNGVAYPLTFTYNIIPKNENELWVLTDAGIELINTQTGALTLIQNEKNSATSLISLGVYSGFLDKNNNFWAGTINGLSKLNGNALDIKSWTSVFRTSETNGLMSIAKGADENIYTSVYFDKAYQVNTTNNKVTAIQHKLNIGNWCLFAKGDEIIRTGSGTSLLSYNTATNKFKELDFLLKYYPTSELVVLGFVHSNGDEWYSGNRGGGFVRKLANDKGFKTYKKDDGINIFTSTYYTTYTEDLNKDVWFGVNKTDVLLHWNYTTDRFNEIDWTKMPSLKDKIKDGINAITHDAENNIWVGFGGSGLIKYNPINGKTIQYTIADGLPSSIIQALQFDKANRLWIATTKGLSCFIASENRFVNFKKEDGLPDDYFTDNAIYFDKEKNTLWVGSNNTLMAFHPDELLKLNKATFPIFIDEVFINGKKYQDTLLNNLSLKASENNIQFRFVGIDVNKGKDIEYSYKMEGADANWIYTGENQTASYANLKYGKYIFKVRARHKGDNKWNEMEIPFEFKIATPWYKTWLFIIFAIAFVGFLIWYIISSYYQRKLEKEKAILDKQNAIEQERTRLARELHDGLGSMLSGIKHSFASIKNNITLNDNQAQNFDTSIEKLNTSIREIRNISHSMMDTDSLLQNGLPNALQDYCRNLNQPNSLKINFEAIAIDNMVLKEEQAFHILRIVQELLQNVLKHSQATEAIVQLSKNNKEINITVEDNGIGFDINKVALKKGIGLKNVADRLKIIKGKMDLKSEASQGTSIFITCPL